MCLAQEPQCSDAGEAQTSDPSVSSQALYYWATALPTLCELWIYFSYDMFCTICNIFSCDSIVYIQ